MVACLEDKLAVSKMKTIATMNLHRTFSGYVAYYVYLELHCNAGIITSPLKNHRPLHVKLMKNTSEQSREWKLYNRDHYSQMSWKDPLNF